MYFILIVMNPGLVGSYVKTHLFPYMIIGINRIFQGPRNSLQDCDLNMRNPYLVLLKVTDGFAVEFSELLGLIFQSLSKY